MPGRTRSRNGFTLLEVLLTLLLVTSAFLALSSAFSLGLSASGNNEGLAVANVLAQEKMEEMRNKSYANVSSEAKAAVSGFSAYQREVAVTTPQTGLKQVTVTVSWYHKDDELTASLVTYVSNI